MFNKKFSILKTTHRTRLFYALIIGFIGFLVLLIETKYSLAPDHDEFYGKLLEKGAEILIVTGFFIFIIEHNTIDKLITKDISISVIKDLFRFYFKKEEMIDLIVELTQDLNKDENIPPDVIALYKRHGLLELFNEPLREDLLIRNSFLEPFDTNADYFWVDRQWSYRVVNTADISKPELERKINKNGLVHQFSRGVYPDEEIKNIEKYLRETLNLKFYVTDEFTHKSNRIKIENHKYIRLKEFDADKGIPKAIPNKIIALLNKNTFYIVYDLKSDESGKNRLIVGFYYDRFIKPGESLGIELTYKSLTKNFNIVSLGFSSYTLGFNFELDLGSEFKTDIAQNIIGKGHIAIKTENRLSYSGWIMPHSSFSYSWARK